MTNQTTEPRRVTGRGRPSFLGKRPRRLSLVLPQILADYVIDRALVDDCTRAEAFRRIISEHREERL